MVARIRYWPEKLETGLVGFAGYKAGMTYAYMIEDNPASPNHGKEVFCPITLVESPQLGVCALRAYKSTVNGLKTLTEAWSKNLPKDITRTLKPPGKASTEACLSKIEENFDSVSDVRIVVCTNPRDSGVHKKKPEVMEIPVGGTTNREKLDYAKNILGKTVSVSDVFKEGQHIDVASISKGKGHVGPVKRFGIRILARKSRKTKRGVGCIGAWPPMHVMSSVPAAGQLGFFQRVELNKRILKIGSDGKEIMPKGGLRRYGLIKGSYLLLKGSVPGPVKRLVWLRHAARSTEKAEPPKISFIHI